MKYITTLLYFTFLTCNVFGHDGEKGFEFSKNKGQWPSNVLYHTKLLQGGMFFEKNKITFDLINSNQINELYNIKHNSPLSETNTAENPVINPRGVTNNKDLLKRNAYSMNFRGANESPLIKAAGQLDKHINYAIGDDQSKWTSNVPVFRQIEYQEIYDGINMQFYSTVKNLKYDFIVSPGANPSDIIIDYDGVKNISLDNEGSLLIKLEDDEVREYRPLSYQTINGKQVIVPCKFVIENKSVRFIFPDGYDSSQELIIDPVILFSTVVGSTADNWGFTATYDLSGNLYAAGIAFGSGYPTTLGSFAGGSFDISVTKWNSAGSAILYSTYIGGSVDDEMPNSLVTNSNNELIMLGSSSSSDYPTTGSAYDQNFNSGTGIYVNMWGSVYAAGCDVVLTKLNATGGILQSTFIGGSDNEGINESLVYNYADQGRGEVVLDAADNIYVCTSGWSTDFPGAIVPNSGSQDAIVFKMNSDLSGLLWSTYYGGSGSDAGYSIRLNSLGEVYICGGTVSTDLNKSPGGLLTSNQGSWDGYLARFNGSTGALMSDTYIGTSSYDQTFILEIDASNDVYMIGQTLGNYSVINAAYSNASSPQFIHKLSSDLTTTIYSTIFGNGSLAPGGFANAINIAPTAFLVDDCGNVYVSGWGGGSNSWSYQASIPFDPQAGGTVASMPITTTGTEQTTTDNSDFYFFVMERDAQGLLYASYFGDPVTLEHTDGGTSRFDPKGIVYQSVCATCGSGSFPSNNALFPGNPANDVCNLGVLKFEFDFQGVEASATVPANITLCSTDYTVNFTSSGSSPQQEWIFGDGGTSTAANPTYTYSDTGSYVVTFIAIDPASCNIRDTAYFNVDIEQAPTFDASFNLPVIPPCSDPASVTVNASITGIGIDSTEWNMGDGTIYTDLTSISHDYTTEAIYPIQVIAWDLTCNVSDTIYDTLHFITAISQAVATAPADTTLCSQPPFSMDFTSAGSPDVFWDFGDGNTSILEDPSNIFADSGSYTVMFVAIDSNTCNIADTVYFNVDLLQAPTFSATINVPVIPPCTDPLLTPLSASFTGSGADSLSWDLGDGTIYPDSTGFTYFYSAPGVYTVTLTAWDFVCNNTNTISEIVNFNSVFSVATATAPEDTTLCSQPPFSMDFTSDGSSPDVFWDFGDGNTSILEDPSNLFADSGSYNIMFVAIDSSTCNIADTVYFNVDLLQAPTFSATINVPVIPPCTDPLLTPLSASFTGSGADSLSWDLGDGTIYPDSTGFTYFYSAPGVYTVTLTAWDFVCNNTNTISEIVNFNSVFSVATATAPEDTTLCSQPPFSMDFTSDGSSPDVFWDFGDGNTSILEDPSNLFADSGSYNIMFVAIDSSTCNIADTVYFNVDLLQAPTFSASFDLPVIPPCSDPSSVEVNIDISGTGIDSTHWDMGDGTTFADSTSISYSYTSTGIYDITITAWDYCGGDTNIFETFNFITDSSLAVASAPEDTTLCTLPPFSIGFTSSGTTAAQFWDFGDGNTSTDVNPTNTFLDSGTYVVTYIAIDSSTCNIADTAYFNVNLIQAEQFSTEINFTPPPPCGGDSMLVELAFSGTAADSLIWDMGNGDVFYADSVAYYYTEAGIYNLSLTAFDFTCNLMEVISSEVPFFGNISTDVIIPNVFTPNGDGQNDLLTFVNVNGSETFRLTIWNRWGKKVFVTDDPFNHWDGISMKDKTINEGVYYFEILFTDVCSDEEQIKTGFVHLMR